MPGPSSAPTYAVRVANLSVRSATSAPSCPPTQPVEGWPLPGGGDFDYQLPRGSVRSIADAWLHAPHRTFPALGLAYVPHGRDGVCPDPDAFTAVGGLEVIARGTTGSDHDWVTLRVDAGQSRP